MKKANLKTLTSRAIVSALIIILIILAALPICAEEEDDTAEKYAAAVLYDKTHSRYIIEENGYAILNTSTSAKIMTGLIACEKLADRLDEKITVTADMISEATGYSMKLKIGEVISISDLLYGAICGSYNDAAYALAHIVAGDTRGFVSMMNTRALELGAKATAYTNPLGYPDNAAMVTTAYDTLKIAVAASDNPLYMEVSSAIKHTVPKTNMTDSRQFYNRNYLISSASTSAYHNDRSAGMNAGNSGEMGGWSVVTLAHDDGADYVCVILGGKESADGEIYAYSQANKLINETCEAYNNYTIFPAGAQLGTTKIGLTGITTDAAPYVAAEDITVYVNTKSSDSKVSYHIEIDEDLKAPISAGECVGKVIISANGEKLGEGLLVLKESYEANLVMQVIDRIGQYTKSRAFVITLVCFIILLPCSLMFRRGNSKGYRKKTYRRY